MYPKLPPELIDIVPDYRIQLLQANSYPDEDWDGLQTGFGAIMKYIKYSGNKAELIDIMQSDDRYHSMDPLTAELINVATGSKLQLKEEEGSVDMCLAIDQLREESINEGLIRGKIEGTIIALPSVGMPSEDIVNKVSKLLQVKPDKVMQIIRELQ